MRETGDERASRERIGDDKRERERVSESETGKKRGNGRDSEPPFFRPPVYILLRRISTYLLHGRDVDVEHEPRLLEAARERRGNLAHGRKERRRRRGRRALDDRRHRRLRRARDRGRCDRGRCDRGGRGGRRVARHESPPSGFGRCPLAVRELQSLVPERVDHSAVEDPVRPALCKGVVLRDAHYGRHGESRLGLRLGPVRVDGDVVGCVRREGEDVAGRLRREGRVPKPLVLGRHVKSPGLPDGHRERVEGPDGQRRWRRGAPPVEVEAPEEGPPVGVRRCVPVRSGPRVHLEAERPRRRRQDVEAPDGYAAAAGRRGEAVDGVHPHVEHDAVLDPPALVSRRQLVQGGALRGRPAGGGQEQGGQEEGGDAAAASASAAIDYGDVPPARLSLLAMAISIAPGVHRHTKSRRGTSSNQLIDF